MLEWMKNIINKITGWVDRLFSNFEGYSAGYSEFIVYALLLYILSKIFKIKLNINTGMNKK
jgi:hypothetical protein